MNQDLAEGKERAVRSWRRGPGRYWWAPLVLRHMVRQEPPARGLELRRGL